MCCSCWFPPPDRCCLWQFTGVRVESDVNDSDMADATQWRSVSHLWSGSRSFVLFIRINLMSHRWCCNSWPQCKTRTSKRLNIVWIQSDDCIDRATLKSHNLKSQVMAQKIAKYRNKMLLFFLCSRLFSVDRILKINLDACWLIYCFALFCLCFCVFFFLFDFIFTYINCNQNSEH